MPVSNEIPYVSCAASGGTTYNFGFKIFDESDLTVKAAGVGKQLGVDYAVAITPEPGEGGSITFQPGKVPAVGSGVIELERNLNLARTTDYQTAGGFRQEVVDRDFDRPVMMIQDRERRLSKAESDIQELLPRVDEAEEDVVALEQRSTSLEGRAGDLEGRAAGLENRVTGVEGRATGVESRTAFLEQAAITEAAIRANVDALLSNKVSALLMGLPAAFFDDYTAAPRVADVIVKGGKHADVRAFMDGVGGRNSLEAWLADPYNTDVTAAWEAAILTQRNVYGPHGIHLISRSLHPKQNQTLFGDSGAGMFPENDNVTFLRLADGANCDLIVGDAGVKYVKLRAMYLDGRSEVQGAASKGVNIVEVPGPNGEECQWDIERCTISNFNGDGVFVGAFRRAARVTNCHIMQNKGHGANINASDCTVERSAIGLNTLDGVYANNWVININGNGLFWNRNGINVSAIGNMAQIGFNGIDRNYSHGIFSYGSNGVILGNVFHINSQTTNGAKNDINIDGTFGSRGTAVVANTFEFEVGSAFRAGYNIAVYNGATIKQACNYGTPESSVHGMFNESAAAGWLHAERLLNPLNPGNASVAVYDTGTYIKRDVADGNFALTVNQANPAATGHIANFQFANVMKAYIDRDGIGVFSFLQAEKLNNKNAQANASVQVPDTGTYIKRDVADGNYALTVNQANAGSLGAIQSFQFVDVEKARVDRFGNIATTVEGAGFQVKEGANARMGVAVLAGGTVVVANTSVRINTRIFLTVENALGVQGHLSVVKTSGVGFTINSTSASEASLVSWLLVEPTA